jgi:GT2 family glycosyltransferase
VICKPDSRPKLLMSDVLADVGVIILNYNTSEETLSCIDSLSDSVFQGFRVLVLDNGSVPEDFNNLSEKIPPDVMLVRSNRNVGFAEGCNLAITKIFEFNPRYILLLNNDIRVDPFMLGRLLKVMEESPVIGAAGPVVYDYWNPKKILSAGIRIRWLSFVFPHSIDANSSEAGLFPREVQALEGSALLLRSSILKRLGQLDSFRFFFQAEDVDYCIRIRKLGYKCVLVPDARVWHKGGASSVRKGLGKETLYFITRGRLQIAGKHYGKPEMLRSSLLHMIPILRRLVSGKGSEARWQLWGILDAWRCTLFLDCKPR